MTKHSESSKAGNGNDGKREAISDETTKSADPAGVDRSTTEPTSPSAEKIIYGPRAFDLRNPQTEQRLIGFVLELGDTDMMCWDAVQHLVQTWCDEGGAIATACGRMLDMERAEFTGELNIYDMNGLQVLLETIVPLIRIEDCCGASPRRCIGHMRAKEGQVSERRVSVAHLSRYFWIALAMKIFDEIMK